MKHADPEVKPLPPLLSFKQAAELIGVSIRTLRTLLTEDWAPVPVELSPRVKKIVRDELLVAIANGAPRRTGRGLEPAQLAAARLASKVGVLA